MSQQRQVQYRERLLSILVELLLDPGPYSVTETAKRYQVTDRKIRKDLNYLIQHINEPAQKDFILKSHGKYEGNFLKNLISEEEKELILTGLQYLLNDQSEYAEEIENLIRKLK